MSHTIVMIDGKPVLIDQDALEFTATATAPPEVDPQRDSPEIVPTQDGGQPPEPQVPSERTTSAKPGDVPWEEWHRRSDAVRTMAREFDGVDHGDIREYLTGRTTRELTDEEVGQMLHDVTAQRVSDIADIFDEQLRSSTERLKRARRTVRVQAPRGWLKRSFNQLDERGVEQVVARLISRGHDSNTISEKVLSRVADEETRTRLQEKIDGGGLKVEFSASTDSQGVPHLQFEPMSAEQAMEFAMGMAETIAANVKVPEVRVEVPVNISGGSKKRIVRDNSGQISEVVDE